jgi:proline dehydrogenase
LRVAARAMGVFNKLLAAAIPYAPDCLVRRIAKPYIAGEDREAAIRAAHALQQDGLHAIINLLGEEDRDPASIQRTLDDYLALPGAALSDGVCIGLSVKPTQLGLSPGYGNYDACLKRLLAIGEQVQTHGSDLWLDMEDHTYTDGTLALHDALRITGRYDTAGVALQARLKRTLDDLVRISRLPRSRVRLCKGIYLEPEDIAYTRKEEIDQSTARLMDAAFELGVYAGMATHDERLIGYGKALLDRHGRDKGEFQMLLGVRNDLARQLAREGYRVTVYAPYGSWEQARAYCERRIRKNPNIAGYVLKNIFTRG